MRIAAAIFVATSWLFACSSAASDLREARLLYKDARYEEAQLWLADLERELSVVNLRDRARFYYLRGMTAFRLGQRDDALHYLMLSAELASTDASYLPADWLAVMNRTLAELVPRDATPHARNPLRPEFW